MIEEKNQEEVVAPEANEEEGNEPETISVPKEEYDKLNQTLGSLKREIKDLKKPKEDPETSKQTKPDDTLLQKLERIALRQANITHEEDMELARKTAKKWGVDIDEVIADEDFQAKLKRQQENRSNVEATSNVKGGTPNIGAKDTPEYWIAKGRPPTREEVPDRKLRAKIAKAMIGNSGRGKTFYNE